MQVKYLRDKINKTENHTIYKTELDIQIHLKVQKLLKNRKKFIPYMKSFFPLKSCFFGFDSAYLKSLVF